MIIYLSHSLGVRVSCALYDFTVVIATTTCILSTTLLEVNDISSTRTGWLWHNRASTRRRCIHSEIVYTLNTIVTYDAPKGYLQCFPTALEFYFFSGIYGDCQECKLIASNLQNIGSGICQKSRTCEIGQSVRDEQPEHNQDMVGDDALRKPLPARAINQSAKFDAIRHACEERTPELVQQACEIILSVPRAALQ